MVCKESIQSLKEAPPKPNTFGIRHVQALLLFCGMLFGFCLRVNISAAIVPMTKPPTTTTANAAPYYDWDSSTKSILLSSFFWGYVVMQVPAGILAKRFGGKIVLGFATFFGAIVTILHPWAAELVGGGGSWKLICLLRIIIGGTQGVLYPSVHTLLAKWMPCTERSFITTTVYSGAQLGTAIMLATSGAIFDSSMGWPGIFYISGAVALLWSLIFLYFGADSPQTSKMISKLEREYIEALTGGSDELGKFIAVPWKSFFTSPPFYAIIAAQSGFAWGFFTLLAEMPTYMDKALKFNVTSNALLSALPYLATFLLSFILGPISDMLINRKILSTTNARKVFNSIGLWTPMVCLIAISYMSSEERMAAITLLTIGVGFNAACFCGYMVNHMDLAPNFAGPMMSITNGLANLCSILATLVVGVIVHDEEDPSEWRIVFFIAAGIYLLTSSIFIVYGQGTIQPWNDLNKTSSANVISMDARNNESTMQCAENVASHF